MFYGMPIHIIRDVALTIRSFYKRITDFLRYRQATRDMNARYPDATSEEVSREEVCIICREDIKPWTPHPNNGGAQPNEGNNPVASNPVDERLRPKKLPCGHILHFACLRSWLERQQICPTCRRPVLAPEPLPRAQDTQVTQQPGRANADANAGQAQPQGGNAVPQQNIYQFGPFRIAFGIRNGAAAPPQNNPAAVFGQRAATPVAGPAQQNRNIFSRQAIQTRGGATPTGLGPPPLHVQLQQIEHQLSREASELRLQADQLHLVRALQSEIARLRSLQPHLHPFNPTTNPNMARNVFPSSHSQPNGLTFAPGQVQYAAMPSHHQLPPGMTLPEGWSLLPLRQISANHNGPSIDNIGRRLQTGHTTFAAQPEPFPSSFASYAEASGRNQSHPVSGPGIGQSPNIPHNIEPETNVGTSANVPVTASSQDGSRTNRSEGSSQHSEPHKTDPSRTTTSPIKPPQQDSHDGPSTSPAASSGLNEQDHGKGSVTHPVDGPPSDVSMAGERAKGKGKATTVEDCADEAD